MVRDADRFSYVAICNDFELSSPSHILCDESPSGAIVIIELERLPRCRVSERKKKEDSKHEKLRPTYMESNDVV
jgi:hypothetical protein